MVEEDEERGGFVRGGSKRPEDMGKVLWAGCKE